MYSLCGRVHLPQAGSDTAMSSTLIYAKPLPVRSSFASTGPVYPADFASSLPSAEPITKKAVDPGYNGHTKRQGFGGVPRVPDADGPIHAMWFQVSSGPLSC
jgi:hypothetical protein